MESYEKHKAIAIPVSFNNPNCPRFLTVKDRRYDEWIFVTGGCKSQELPLHCALRELEEETRGTVRISAGLYSYFNFRLYTHPFVSVYHVYVIEYNISRYQQQLLECQFSRARNIMHRAKMQGKRVKRVYDENDDMRFDTITEMESHDKIWPLIQTNVLENPAFRASVLARANRRPFSVRRRW